MPEIKESFYYGQDFPLDSPEVKAGRFNCGPNIYPESLGDNFRSTSNQYYESVYKLAQDVLTVLALGLGVGSDFFKDFATDALGTIRYFLTSIVSNFSNLNFVEERTELIYGCD